MNPFEFPATVLTLSPAHHARPLRCLPVCQENVLDQNATNRKKYRILAVFRPPFGPRRLDQIQRSGPTSMGVLGWNSFRKNGKLVHQPNIFLWCSSTSGKNDHRWGRIPHRVQWYLCLWKTRRPLPWPQLPGNETCLHISWSLSDSIFILDCLGIHPVC